MKKIIVLFLGLFLVSGCSNVVSQEKWEKLDLGMSIEDVEKEVGKPLNTETDNGIISEQVYSDYKKMYEMNSIIKNSDLEERMNQLDMIYTSSKSDEVVKQYTYKVETSDKSREAEMYFVNGVLRYINRANE
ncbi:membrane lipoprotein lipid attachment site-containing protein [Enterococcus thailandicus]|uniref:membrane lipoprotein lipid attachment site-containing protein n=1 Tax=Enterococcus thailandicus TaxID=417368 RepID=UPI002543D146|nr:membrane lipoprotein lipid attachment site-containing protein [Enterococcus thailandicus]MDK4353320.1 membrane lipoprotein lipid attachment site-containing protein [Enterococcus thailandicus]MDT2752909.1 membrane lipoprotein lipid attachment site-containing protein [Enterococcus thailandicus]MDT2774936.1 membrane lipoprotein lipid attachment site-containing protein [Enterococcus thailandicus]